MIDAKMTLDVQKNGVQKTVYIKEGETAGARRLIITLTNNGKVVGVVGKTVFCYIRRPSGDTMVTNLVTDATYIDDDTNTIIFDVPSLSEGTHYLELVVQDSSANQIYSPTFCIIAEDALYTSASGSFSPNTAYIVVTDDNFYTETEVDDLLLDYATKAELGGKIDAPDDAEDKQVLTYDATTEKWVPADPSDGGDALVIELEKVTGSTTEYTTDTTVADITAAMEAGSPILVVTDNFFPKICKPSNISYSATMGGTFTGWYLRGVDSYSSSQVKFYSFEFKTAHEGTVYYEETTMTGGGSITLDDVPTQNSNNAAKSGGIYTAIQTAKSEAIAAPKAKTKVGGAYDNGGTIVVTMTKTGSDISFMWSDSNFAPMYMENDLGGQVMDVAVILDASYAEGAAIQAIISTPYGKHYKLLMAVYSTTVYSYTEFEYATKDDIDSTPDFVVTATGNDFLKGEMTGGVSVTLSTSKTLTELLAKATAHEELDVKGTIYVEDSDPDYAEEGVFDVQKYDLWYYRYGTADYINYLLEECGSEDTTARPGIALVFQHTFPRGNNKNVSFDRFAAWAIIVYESESTPGTISYEYTDDLSNLL